jgi:hypothetical protein
MKTRSDSFASSPSSLDAIFRRAMRRVRANAANLIKGPALAGAMVLSGPSLIGCAAEDLPDVGQDDDAAWMHDEGQRNTDMVSYTGDYWVSCRNQNPRFGCTSYDVFIKLRVRPVAGADLAWKRVGVEYRLPTTGEQRTAVGYYSTTWGNGDEEWHVAINVPAWQDLFTFTAWYQDGAAHTYYDDNSGEYHVINGDSDVNQVVRAEPWIGTVAIDASGVKGTLFLQLADLDYDKEVRLVATVDGWNTVLEFGMGQPGETNRWHWSEDLWGGYERWAIDLDIPGDYQELKYAILYRHGVVNGARSYEFWDNNHGFDHSVRREVIE